MGRLPSKRGTAINRTSGRSNTGPRCADFLEQGALRLDLLHTRAFVTGREIRLPLAQFRVLERLLENSGRIVTRAELVQAAFGQETENDKLLSSLIASLRGKLGAEHGKQIKLVYGVGYCFRPDPPRLPRCPEARPRSGDGAPASDVRTANRDRLPSTASKATRPVVDSISPEKIARRLPEPVWALFESVLPPAPAQTQGKLPVSNHRILHGLLYVLITGVGWDFVPPCFPSGRTIRRRARQWLELDAFHVVWQELARCCPALADVNWGKVLDKDGTGY